MNGQHMSHHSQEHLKIKATCTSEIKFYAFPTGVEAAF